VKVYSVAFESPEIVVFIAGAAIATLNAGSEHITSYDAKGAPPVLVGATQSIRTVWLAVCVAVTEAGASGIETGITVVGYTVFVLLSTRFLAYNDIVYGVPFTSPGIVTLFTDIFVWVAVKIDVPAVAIAVYEVIGAPPLSSGGV
jgi:hypothetical protein